eukprot:351462-Chlamydomonas_euryale.AAC.1
MLPDSLAESLNPPRPLRRPCCLTASTNHSIRRDCCAASDFPPHSLNSLPVSPLPPTHSTHNVALFWMMYVWRYVPVSLPKSPNPKHTYIYKTCIQLYVYTDMYAYVCTPDSLNPRLCLVSDDVRLVVCAVWSPFAGAVLAEDGLVEPLLIASVAVNQAVKDSPALGAPARVHTCVNSSARTRPVCKGRSGHTAKYRW